MGQRHRHAPPLTTRHVGKLEGNIGPSDTAVAHLTWMIRERRVRSEGESRLIVGAWRPMLVREPMSASAFNSKTVSC